MNRRIALVPVALTAALVAGCATGVQPDDPYAIRLDQVTQHVDRLERILNTQNLAELSQRMDDIESQVRDLRGQVQELAHAVDESDTRQRHLYQDLDRRLRALETGGAQPGGAAAAPAPSEAGVTPREDYDHAFALLQQGQYDQAQKAFSDFIDQHPDDPLTANAEYWLGETRYVSRDYDAAVDAFQKVVDKFPKSSKVPGALLKIGYSYDELHQWSDAQQALEKVVKNYPQSTEARLANERLKQLKRQGH